MMNGTTLSILTHNKLSSVAESSLEIEMLLWFFLFYLCNATFHPSMLQGLLEHQVCSEIQQFAIVSEMKFEIHPWE